MSVIFSYFSVVRLTVFFTSGSFFFFGHLRWAHHEVLLCVMFLWRCAPCTVWYWRKPDKSSSHPSLYLTIILLPTAHLYPDIPTRFFPLGFLNEIIIIIIIIIIITTMTIIHCFRPLSKPQSKKYISLLQWALNWLQSFCTFTTKCRWNQDV
jgi:hypothetical protein